MGKRVLRQLGVASGNEKEECLLVFGRVWIVVRAFGGFCWSFGWGRKWNKGALVSVDGVLEL